MATKKTTLILGAGSSLSYGFPPGMQLREKILSLSNDMDTFSEVAHVGKATV